MSKIFLLLFLLPLILTNSHIPDKNYRGWSRTFLEMFRAAADLPKKKIAVACPDEHSMLESVSFAHRIKLAELILIGDEENMKKLAKFYKYDISGMKIIDIKDRYLASLTAAKMVHDGECDILMRGYVPVSDFVRVLHDEKYGLVKKDKKLTYIIMAEIEGIDQLLFLSDGEIITKPTLEDKVQIIENAVEMANIFRVRNPRVAALASVEYVNPEMQATVDAAELKKMNEEGKIKNCLIEGPIGMDMAISLDAVADKGMWNSKIRGDADILLFPDFEAVNMSWRLVRYIKRHMAAMLLGGTTKPVIMTGRGDDLYTKINSIAMAKWMDEYLKVGEKWTDNFMYYKESQKE